MIEAAIVGVGWWGRTLVKAVQGKSNRLRFTRAVSRTPDRLAEFAARHDLVAVGELAAVLDDPSVDAVVLATPHSRHRDEILAAAAAGKAVYCEKPLALTKDDATRAIAACERAGVVLGIGTDKRFFPAARELSRLVKAGELGPIRHLEAHASNENSGRFAAWRYDPEESPAGGMTGTGVHILDALVDLAGPVRRVQAQWLKFAPMPDPQDSIAVLLEFASGVGATLAAVRTTPFFWRIHAFGHEGSAEALGRSDLVLRRSGAEPHSMRFPPVDSVRAALEAFADAVAGRAPYPIPTSDMLAVAAAFEAIADAAGSPGRVREV